jgi:predicted amidohydrolase
MQLIACQYDIQWENREANFDTIRRLLAYIDIQPGALIVLPEMFSSGFSMNVDRIAEENPSLAEAFLSEIALKYESWTLGGLVYRLNDGLGSNELSVFGPKGQRIGHYQKNHCFSYTGETDHYESGEDILIFDWHGFSVCPTICYDLRFPELYRRGVNAGANLFPVIASWPEKRAHHWTTLLKARAIENQAFVIGVNRVGQDPAFTYPGLSTIIDPHGIELATADNTECCIVSEISLETVTDWREEFQALNDTKDCH